MLVCPGVAWAGHIKGPQLTTHCNLLWLCYSSGPFSKLFQQLRASQVVAVIWGFVLVYEGNSIEVVMWLEVAQVGQTHADKSNRFFLSFSIKVGYRRQWFSAGLHRGQSNLYTSGLGGRQRQISSEKLFPLFLFLLSYCFLILFSSFNILVLIFTDLS